MTARPQDVALLPLPEWCLDDDRALYVLEGMSGPQYRNDMEDYARANLSAALASAQAREEELRAGVERLEAEATQHYQRALSNGGAALEAEARAERLEEALRYVLNQNEHDMVLTGDEIRAARAALSTNAAQPGETTLDAAGSAEGRG